MIYMHIVPHTGIPPGIIFLPAPNLRIESIEETKGYGWAPLTWLAKQAHTYPLFRPLRRTATIMKRGLGVQFPGIILHLPNTMVEEARFRVTVHQCMHKWFKIVVDTQGKDWKTFWETEISVPQHAEPSIIMSTPNPRDRWEVGVLVRNKGLLSQGEVR